ncbi:MAG: 50S ribosomal protein L23 [Clostridia bacterium]|nr:50S ribosomal protein L23 [Clostridia bacterium]
MKSPESVVLAPVVTEESMKKAGDKVYVFKVERTANKPEIANAVEQLFGVEVASVNTINMHGKFRRYGRFEGYTSDWKKAIVTLKADSDPIEFFDGLL